MKIASILILTSLSCISFGQQEVIIIDKGDMKDYKREKEIKFNDNIQAFKFAPLNLMVGEINFGYERQVSLKGSLDFEIGPTISKIGFGIDSHTIDPIGGTPQQNEVGGLGFLLGAGYRFYPLDETEALNRFYVSPVVKYKLMNHYVEDLSGTLDEIRGSNSLMSFSFNFGYQVWVAKKFALDFYGGLGIGYQRLSDYYVATEFDGTDWVYKWQEQGGRGSRYVFNMGLKVGIGAE